MFARKVSRTPRTCDDAVELYDKVVRVLQVQLLNETIFYRFDGIKQSNNSLIILNSTYDFLQPFLMTLEQYILILRRLKV